MTLKGSRYAHWNYRVVEQRHKQPDGTTEVAFGIHEMYYDGEGHDGWTSEPVAVTACSVDALRVELDRMLTALEMDIIVDREGQ